MGQFCPIALLRDIFYRALRAGPKIFWIEGKPLDLLLVVSHTEAIFDFETAFFYFILSFRREELMLLPHI